MTTRIPSAAAAEGLPTVPQVERDFAKLEAPINRLAKLAKLNSLIAEGAYGQRDAPNRDEAEVLEFLAYEMDTVAAALAANWLAAHNANVDLTFVGVDFTPASTEAAR